MTTTEKTLQVALEDLNKNLEPTGRYMKANSRYGYFVLELYGSERDNCIENFATVNSNKQLLELVYALTRVLELTNNPI